MLVKRLKDLNKKFGINIVINLGGPIDIMYDDQKYYISKDLGDITFCDNRSKTALLFIVETLTELQIKFSDGTVIENFKKI